MNKIVSFEIANLLEEKNIIIPSKKVYDNGILKNKPSLGLSTLSDYGNRFVTAPTITDVVMWLYDKHGFWIYTKPILDNDGEWIFKGYVKNLNNFKSKEHQTKLLQKPNESYESAIEYCLKNLI